MNATRTLFMLCCLLWFSMPVLANEGGSQLTLFEPSCDGELAVVVSSGTYSEFAVSKNGSKELLFVSDYIPLNLLSDKSEIPQIRETGGSKFSFEEKLDNSGTPGRIELKKSFF